MPILMPVFGYSGTFRLLMLIFQVSRVAKRVIPGELAWFIQRARCRLDLEYFRSVRGVAGSDAGRWSELKDGPVLVVGFSVSGDVHGALRLMG